MYARAHATIIVSHVSSKLYVMQLYGKVRIVCYRVTWCIKVYSLFQDEPTPSSTFVYSVIIITPVIARIFVYSPLESRWRGIVPVATCLDTPQLCIDFCSNVVAFLLHGKQRLIYTTNIHN